MKNWFDSFAAHCVLGALAIVVAFGFSPLLSAAGFQMDLQYLNTVEILMGCHLVGFTCCFLFSWVMKSFVVVKDKGWTSKPPLQSGLPLQLSGLELFKGLPKLAGEITAMVCAVGMVWLCLRAVVL